MSHQTSINICILSLLSLSFKVITNVIYSKGFQRIIIQLNIKKNSKGADIVFQLTKTAHIINIRILRICIRSSFSSKRSNDINKSSVVLNSPFSASCLLLFLFLLLNFRCLPTDFASPSQRTMNLSS